MARKGQKHCRLCRLVYVYAAPHDYLCNACEITLRPVGVEIAAFHAACEAGVYNSQTIWPGRPNAVIRATRSWFGVK